MKIRTKLALSCAAFCVLAILACSAALLSSANKNNLDSAIDNALAEQNMLIQSFSGALDAAYEATLSETAEYSLVNYLFRRYAASIISQSHYALASGGAYIHNGSELDAAAVLQGNAVSAMENGGETARYTVAEQGGARQLVIGSAKTLHGRDYEIYLVKSIEPVYQNNAALTLRVAAIALCAVLAAAAGLVLLVFRTLKPLKELESSAGALSGGDYASRIPVKGGDEIASLSVSFNQMAAAVERHIGEINDVAESRRLLLGALTHELKTPLTAVIGYSEALQRTRLTKEQREEAIAYIHSECRRIERLSQKMMQLIALDDPGRIALLPVRVRELFAAVERTIAPIAKENGVSLSMRCDDETIHMDADLMASVLLNLFDNAHKAQAKHIMIAWEDHVLSVTDDGRGIPEHELKRITEPFYMVDKSRSRKAGGVGLGLALVQRIAALHGATMHIMSQADLDTIVEITF